MIQSFRDHWLREFYLKDKTSKKIPAEVQDRLFRKLQLIDDATCDLDLRSPPASEQSFRKVERKFGREAFDPR